MPSSIRFALVNSESFKVPSEWSAFSAWSSATKADAAVGEPLGAPVSSGNVTPGGDATGAAAGATGVVEEVAPVVALPAPRK